jgi:hypothetical protein
VRFCRRPRARQKTSQSDGAPERSQETTQVNGEGSRGCAKAREKIDAKLATLQCPSIEEYRAKDAASDKERMLYLWRKRRSRAKLTPNEDAELAHVNARYWAYRLGPESRARDRLSSLSKKARVHVNAFGPPLGPWEKGELSVLTTVYRPGTIKLTRDSDDFLERHSIFSDCEYDAEGFPMEYHRLEEDFEEFAEVPRFSTVDRELSAKEGAGSSSQ